MIEVLDTDITKLDVDAIANAANIELRHGGGRGRGDRPRRRAIAGEREPGEGPDRWRIRSGRGRSRWSRSGPGGGFPVEEAAEIEVDEVRRHLEGGSSLERVVFAVRGEAAVEAFQRAL